MAINSQSFSTNDVLFDGVTGNPHLDPIWQQSRGWLHSFATSPNFTNQMQLAFGDSAQVSNLQKTWASDRLGTLPEIEIFPTSELDGANGAFAAETNTIYLSQEVLSEDVGSGAQVFLEEYGHYLDSQLTPTDAPGDEGAIFSEVVSPNVLSRSEFTQLQAEDDTATVSLDGNPVNIEQNFLGINIPNNFFSNSLDFINNLIETPRQFLSDVLDRTSTQLPDDLSFNNLVSDLQDGGLSQAVDLLGQVAGFSFPVFSNLLFGDSQNVNDLIDLLTQDTGNNFVFAGDGNDTILGGQGVDVLNGNNDNDMIFGGQDEDIINGNNDNNTIFGGQQRDVINGGNGDNFLSGDLGEDTLTGGAGSDRFLLRDVSGADIITDFVDGIDSLALPTDNFPLQPNGLSFDDLNIFQAEGGTVISYNGNTIAALTGIDATTITEEDFQQVSSF
jgi:hypothetical protein